MKLRTFLLVAVVMAALFVVSSSLAQAGPFDPQAALGTAFTYQGRLTDGGAPANGTYDFEFRLYDALSSGAQVGSSVVKDNVSVTSGVFTVQLDFGASAFTGNARWLQIGVRAGSSTGAYTALSPRQELTATPYAHYAASAPWSGLSSMPAGFADGVDNEGWSLTGNSGTNASTNFLGTTNNVALTLRVSNTIGLRLIPSSGTPNVIGGYSGNSAAAGVEAGTIGGGGLSGAINQVTGDYGTIGGGRNNLVGVQADGTVGGGSHNTASDWYSTVSGGANNTASGQGATVVGGGDNTASGMFSTAFGRYAVASHYNETAHAGGSFGQESYYVLGALSSGTTPEELSLFYLPPPGLPERLTVASGRTMTFDILITARSQSGESAGYTVRGVIENVGGSTHFIGGTPSVTTLGEDNAAWNVTVEASDAQDALIIRATGSTGASIRWIASVHTAEVTY